MNLVKSYKNFIFDLDDTIYDEKAYLFPCYQEIAMYLHEKLGSNQFVIYEFLEKTFLQQGRTSLFNHLVNEFSIPESEIDQFLEIMRTIRLKNRLEPFSAVKDLLCQLSKSDKRLFVITNGNPQQQKNKVAQIKWYNLSNQITFVYANEHRKKPAASAFEATNIQANELAQTVMIGDSETDFLFAENVGIDFLNINYILHETRTSEK